jgi:predicted DNA-binding transcriptional regulator YafY
MIVAPHGADVEVSAPEKLRTRVKEVLAAYARSSSLLFER